MVWGVPADAAFRGWLPACRRNALLMFGGLVVVGLVVLIALSFEVGGRAFGISGDRRLSDGVRVHANVEKMVPEDDQLVVRLDFEPKGRFARDRHFLAQRVRLVAFGGAGLVDETSDAGGVMTPKVLPVALEGGDISQYPFDRYNAVFGVRIFTGDGATVPSVLISDASVHGYSVSIADPTAEPNGGNDLTISVRRAPATLAVAGFVVSLMWTLTILALMLAVSQIRGDGPIEGTLISLFGVLLFSYYAVRNSMPNTPALGTLVDYVSYFWCEVALGVGLVALLIARVRQG
jgi:Domain of unknown function (DUF4436)